MEYKEPFEKEIINRTLSIVNEYKGNFEKTALVNCCIGLLIVPEQKFYDKLPNKKIDGTKWGIDASLIQKCSKKTIKDVARHIRNAVAHNGITFMNENNEVAYISIVDKVPDVNGNKITTFEIDKLPFDNFKTFVLEFANCALKNYK